MGEVKKGSSGVTDTKNKTVTISPEAINDEGVPLSLSRLDGVTIQHIPYSEIKLKRHHFSRCRLTIPYSHWLEKVLYYLTRTNLLRRSRGLEYQ
jgi:hypothetical protein